MDARRWSGGGARRAPRTDARRAGAARAENGAEIRAEIGAEAGARAAGAGGRTDAARARSPTTGSSLTSARLQEHDGPRSTARPVAIPGWAAGYISWLQ